MENANFCLVCNHAEKDTMKGVYCGLTNDKPRFGAFCEKISFGEKLLKEIETLTLNNTLTQRKKWLCISNFVVFLLIGICFFYAGYSLWDMTYQQGYLSTAPFVLLFIGGIILPASVGPMRLYLTEHKHNSKKISNLDKVLDQYGISYESEIQVTKQRHNILLIKIDIKVRKGRTLIQEYSNTFDYNDNEKKVSEYSFGQSVSGEGANIFRF